MPNEKTPSLDPVPADGKVNKRDDGCRLLQIASLITGYGKKPVLNGVDLDVAPGEIVALIGTNGAGKSTLLKAIFGLLPVWEGQITFDGRRVLTPTPREWLRVGVSYVPQGNRVFNDLTVRENLEIAANMIRLRANRTAGIDRALMLYPQLRERLQQRAGTLSGGEKQILALASALVLSPRLLLLDEPSLGLAPRLVTDALRLIEQIAKEKAVAVLIVEQKVRKVLKIAQRVYVLSSGVVSFSGPANALQDEAKLRNVYLGKTNQLTKEMAHVHGAHHEGGHAVLIHFFDLRIKNIRKLPVGRDTFNTVVADEDAPKTLETVTKYAFKRGGQSIYFRRGAFIAAGGPVAGRIYEKDWDNAAWGSIDDQTFVAYIFRRDSKDDVRKILGPLEQAGVPTPEAMSLVRQLCEVVHDILESRWAAITAIATELRDKDCISGERAYQIVERALKGE